MHDTDDALYCPHSVGTLSTLRGGIRRYPGEVHGWIGFRDLFGEDVSIGSDDRAGFVAALRRAADEIELGANELPPVTETGEQFQARAEQAIATQSCMNCGQRYGFDQPAPPGFCSYDCASLAHVAIVNPHDWRL